MRIINLKSKEGATVIEYSLIATLIMVMVIGALRAFGTRFSLF